jgi:hypothetical protein
LLECGERRSPVEEGRVFVTVAPGSGSVGELAVQDPAGLVFFQPRAKPWPGAQQDVMRYLSGIPIEDH